MAILQTLPAQKFANMIHPLSGCPEGDLMGLNIVEVDFSGNALESIADPRNLLHQLLPRANEQSEALLTKIDWYGDTYFNYLQLKRFLVEWDELGQRAQSPEQKELIEGVRRIAQRCQENRSLLRFIGD